MNLGIIEINVNTIKYTLEDPEMTDTEKLIMIKTCIKSMDKSLKQDITELKNLKEMAWKIANGL